MILNYSYGSGQIHKHTAKNKVDEIKHEDNYLFIPQTLDSRETHSGRNLTNIFGM